VKIEVFVDGGIRRGTDVLKALALGATAVGVGKPAVYSMSAYGQEGIEKMLQILKDELVMAMRLCGATKISDLTPALVNTVDLERHTGGFAIPRSPFAPPRFPPPPAAAVADKAGAGEVTITCPPWAATLVDLVVVMLRKIVVTTFAASSGEMLTRSAIFMLSFLVVHMLGNLTVFFGEETFNACVSLIERARSIATTPSAARVGHAFALSLTRFHTHARARTHTHTLSFSLSLSGMGTR